MVGWCFQDDISVNSDQFNIDLDVDEPTVSVDTCLIVTFCLTSVMFPDLRTIDYSERWPLILVLQLTLMCLCDRHRRLEAWRVLMSCSPVLITTPLLVMAPRNPPLHCTVHLCA
jgi:hypothetical protein